MKEKTHKAAAVAANFIESLLQLQLFLLTVKLILFGGVCVRRSRTQQHVAWRFLFIYCLKY